MANFESKSYETHDMQLDFYDKPTSNPNFTTHNSFSLPQSAPNLPYSFDYKLKKSKSASGSSSSSKVWCFSDPEFQRKKRVANYRVYAVEGKVKGSLRRSFKWIKDRYSRVVHGW